MHDCLKELLKEYEESLKGIKQLKNKVKERQCDKSKVDTSLINGMERDLEWTIKYMKTGYMPEYSIGRYKNIVPVDPQKVLSLCSKPLVSSKPSKNKLTDSLLELFKVLRDKEKEALMLVVIEGISYGKAGKYLGIKRKTVESIVRRAKKKLEAAYIKEGRGVVSP